MLVGTVIEQVSQSFLIDGKVLRNFSSPVLNNLVVGFVGGIENGILVLEAVVHVLNVSAFFLVSIAHICKVRN